jgi:murein DD-endopeptidase MepM/ murein hydrolase activator NlpD
VLAAAAAAAFALCWSPPARVSADLINPSPTPCTLPPPLTCAVPSPPPVVTASPSPQPASTPPATTSGSAPPAAPAVAPKSTGGTPPVANLGGGISLAEVETLQATLGSSPLVEQLLSILRNPVAAQRPDLLHFQPAAQRRALGAVPSRNAVPAIAAFALLWIWMAAAPLLRLKRAIARPVVAAAALAPAVLAASLVAPPLASKPPAPARVAAARNSSPQVWSRLVAVEARLAADERSLAAVEARLQQLTLEIQNDQPAERVQPHVFAALAAVHDSRSAAYEGDLQEEYQLYLGAAEQPAVAQALRTGAAASGVKPAAHAVDANLQTVVTQLQQEAAISQAEARLQQLGFTPAQAEALQSHDAFVAPLGGPIGQPFGPTDFPLEPPLQYQGQFYPHFHTGIDIEAPLGSTIVAPADGVVALVASSTDGHGHSTGYGTYVLIAHAHGYMTLYAHLGGVMVTAGQLVHQGQPIAVVGTTGNSTGPHLHFEIRRDGAFLDPLPYVTGRLKPW